MPTAGNKNDNLIWWHNQPKSTHPFWARYIFNVTLEVTSSCVWRNCLFQKMVRYLNLFPSNRRMMIRTTHWFEICLSMGMKHLFVGHTIPIHTPFSKGLRGAPAASSSASFLCSCLGRITPRNKWKVTCNYTCLYIYIYIHTYKYIHTHNIYIYILYCIYIYYLKQLWSAISVHASSSIPPSQSPPPLQQNRQKPQIQGNWCLEWMLLVVADKAQIEHQGTQNTEDESRKLMSGHLPKTSTLQGISGVNSPGPPPGNTCARAIWWCLTKGLLKPKKDSHRTPSYSWHSYIELIKA